MFYININSKNTGFTLIELLVVIAIIGVLATIVIASLNSAREKGKIASIKSTLKQLYNQTEINYLETGSYSGSNSSYTNLDCTGPGNNLQKIVKPLVDQGIIIKCFSFYGTGYASGPDVYDGDDYQRFGATALIYDTDELKAWSVDENGVVKWDTKGVNSSGNPVTPDITANWVNSQRYCAISGGRLASVEQARTLSHAWHQGSGSTSWTPPSFTALTYWTSTPTPSSLDTLSYRQSMASGNLFATAQTTSYYVHCVR